MKVLLSESKFFFAISILMALIPIQYQTFNSLALRVVLLCLMLLGIAVLAIFELERLYIILHQRRPGIADLAVTVAVCLIGLILLTAFNFLNSYIAYFIVFSLDLFKYLVQLNIILTAVLNCILFPVSFCVVFAVIKNEGVGRGFMNELWQYLVNCFPTIFAATLCGVAVMFLVGLLPQGIAVILTVAVNTGLLTSGVVVGVLRGDSGKNLVFKRN